jgi:hypothetical protein
VKTVSPKKGRKANAEPLVTGSLPTDNSAAQPTPIPVAPQLQSEEKASADRVAIAWYVGEDGKIQWDRMRESTREQMKALLANKEVLEQLGISKAEVIAPGIEVFDPSWCGALYDGLGTVEQIIATRFFKASPKVAAEVFTYSKVEKDKLAEPTAKVINKYAPEWLIRFKDEIALAGLLVSMTMAKIAALSALMQLEIQLERAKAQQSAPVNGKTETPPPAEASAA